MTTSFLQTLWTDPQRRLLLVGSAAVGLILLIGVSAYALGREYLLDEAIEDTAQMVSREAIFFAEVRNPARTLKDWEASAAASRLAKLPAYQNLRAAPQLQAYNDLSYLLELKTGLAPTDIIDSLDRPLGFAWFPEQAFVLIARTDLKSRMGIRLLEALKGKTIELPNEADFDRVKDAAPASEETADQEGETEIINQEEAAPVLLERPTELSNLKLTRIEYGSRSVFMLLLGDVFFLSDSLERLEESLLLAGNADAKSLGTLAGMPAARERLKKQDAGLLVYGAALAESWGVAAATIGGDRGLIAVLRKSEDAARAPGDVALRFDLFPAGAARFASARAGNESKKDRAFPARDFARLAPRDSLAQFITSRDTPASLLEYFEDVSGPSGAFANRFEDFASAAKLKLTLPEQERDGFSLIWRGFAADGRSLYPHGLVALPDAKATSLLEYGAAVFGQPNQNEALQFQNISYTRTGRKGRHYEVSAAALSVAGQKPGVLATRTPDLTATISASLGTRPANSDQSSYKTLGEHADDPIQIIVNLNEARLALRALFQFGATRNPDYSIKTINRDVMPLVDAFRDYGVLHLTAGSNQAVYGTLVVTHQ
ncbi:MAG: hypothetical protein NXI24_14860 [bacterium]|nr:hypothetical protein [bacterium]